MQMLFQGGFKQRRNRPEIRPKATFGGKAQNFRQLFKIRGFLFDKGYRVDSAAATGGQTLLQHVSKIVVEPAGRNHARGIRSKAVCNSIAERGTPCLFRETAKN